MIFVAILSLEKRVFCRLNKINIFSKSLNERIHYSFNLHLNTLYRFAFSIKLIYRFVIAFFND